MNDGNHRAASFAIVGVFVEIPIVTDYAFWILAAAYLVSVGDTQFSG